MGSLRNSLFETIFMQVRFPALILRADTPGYLIMTSNESYVQSTGISSKLLVGSALKNSHPFFQGKDSFYSIVEAGLLDSFISAQPRRLKLVREEAIKQDTKTTDSIEIRPVFDQSGQLNFLLLIFDIPRNNLDNELSLEIDRLNTERIQVSEKQSVLILNALPEIAWTNDIDGNLTFINQRWINYTGQNLAETVEMGWIHTVHKDDQQRAIQQFGSILGGAEIGEFELRKKNQDGNFCWFLTRLAPILDKSGKVIYWIGTSTNIEELKRVQKQKDEFIDVASHELKTPLTSLKVSMQLMKERMHTLSPIMFDNLFDRSVRSLDKVVDLVDDLLNAGKFNLGQLALVKSQLSITDFINDVILDFALPSSHSICITGICNRQVFADGKRIEQVLNNLLNNAVKYAPDSKCIELSIKETENELLVSIIDKGPGIGAEKIPNLFNRYYRIENPDYNNTGLGLGLFICAEIIAKHGGLLKVKSIIGEGSTFSFSLPLTNEVQIGQKAQQFDIHNFKEEIRIKQKSM